MNKIKRRLTRRELKKKNKKIILSSLLIICLLSVGYGAFQTILNINVVGHIVVDERCVEGNVFNFEALDEIQEFKVPCSGTYKLETWGASGGDVDDTYIGGYGGYSVGNMNLKIKKKLYLNIGGKGVSNNGALEIINGGYNGGGDAAEGQGGYCASGGGATSLTSCPKLLYNLYAEGIQQKDEILIVSGGGGGAISNSIYPSFASGGHAGGFIGSICETQTDRTKIKKASGGTQVSGGEYGLAFTNSYTGIDKTNGDGKFGKGGSLSAYAWDVHVSGGGGGYYGGGAGYLMSSGGGSSYIGNNQLTDKAMYCYECEESLDLTKPEIFTVSTTGDSNYKDTLNCPNGYSENPISKCAKKGDGYARITLISKK